MDAPATSLVGRLVGNPQTRSTTSGIVVTSFRLACPVRRYDRSAGRTIDANPLLVTVNCWRRLAENVAQSLAGGDRVVVIGRLRQRGVTCEDGTRRAVIEIEADAVGPDLERSAVTVQRPTRSVDRTADRTLDRGADRGAGRGPGRACDDGTYDPDEEGGTVASGAVGVADGPDESLAVGPPVVAPGANPPARTGPPPLARVAPAAARHTPGTSDAADRALGSPSRGPVALPVSGGARATAPTPAPTAA